MESYEQNFNHYYQKLVFQESVSNDFTKCSALRKRMTQAFAASVKMVNNESTCMLLEKSLDNYTAIVDNRHEEAVNNYAKSTLALATRCKTEVDQWKCSLSDVASYIAKYVRPLQCDLVEEQNANVCSSWEVTDLDIQKLKKAQATKRSFADQEAVAQAYERKPAEIQNKHLTRNETISAAESLEIAGQQRKNFIPNQRTECLGKNSLGWKRPSDPQMPQIKQFAPKVPCKENKLTSRVSHLDGNMTQGASSRNAQPTKGFFKTARDELGIQNMKKWGNRGGNSSSNYSYAGNYGSQKRCLGTRRGVMDKFVPPIKPETQSNHEGSSFQHQSSRNWDEEETEIDERLKNIDPKMIELIRSEIMDVGPSITWDDIAGLEFAKSTIQEVVVWPLLRPDIFTGLRRPPKGILLFGPPGTGKTLIGKCIASQSNSTFFSISASSLTSKWIGDGEKMVRALFAVARCHQPAVVFIDEIDSLLTQRSDTEHESSRRIKTEFLVQLDGAATGEEDRILVIGATNRPQELDEAARRRLVKKLYIPLPDSQARQQIVERLMSKENNSLAKRDIEEIAELTAGYSGADMKNLCQEASLGPIRSLGFIDIQYIQPDQVRPVSLEDFKLALTRIRASVSPGDLDSYVTWDKQYGSGGVAVSNANLKI